MLFSVVVPVYNIEQYIRQCIDTLIDQNYEDYEIILVDDGSSDASGKICDEYEERHQRVKVIHQENGGLVKARKVGAQAASGEYIVPVDGDDWVDVNLLTVLSEIIGKTHVDMVSYGHFLALPTGENIAVGENRRETGTYKRDDIVKKLYRQILRDETGHYFRPNIWGNAFRRETYLELQLKVDDRISNGEDAAVIYPMLTTINSLYVSDQFLYFYRRNENSMLRSRKKGYSWENLSILAAMLRDGIRVSSQEMNDQFDRYFSHALFNVAKSHFQAGGKYWEIRKEIILHITQDENRKYIKQARFRRFSKDHFANFVLRYRLIGLIWLYALIDK
ncbi:MAG: glycosyltransferase [Acetatifactor sp.]|nr:glycosyltransferase [Acetatifactor sp.]